MHDWESISHVRRDCKLCSAEHNLHLMPVHVHMCLKIPPKYSVAHAIGFLKGKSAVRIHREILDNKRVTGLHFWARGYCVSTIGLDEDTIKKYIREQEDNEKKKMELDLE